MYEWRIIAKSRDTLEDINQRGVNPPSITIQSTLIEVRRESIRTKQKTKMQFISHIGLNTNYSHSCDEIDCFLSSNLLICI